MFAGRAPRAPPCVSNGSATRATRLSRAKAPQVIDAASEQDNSVKGAARLLIAPTVAVERIDGIQVLCLAVRFYHRLSAVVVAHGLGTEQSTQTEPIAKWAHGVCFVAAFFAVEHPLAQDVLSFLLGRRRACYYGCQRCRRGPASLGAALRYGRRAPAGLRLRRLTPAWRWRAPAACSVLGPRARRCSLATPRPRALASPARARPRALALALAPPVAPIVTRAVCSAVHARALTSHTRLTLFGSCRTDAFRCAAIQKCSQLAQKAQLYAGSANVQSTRASVCRDTSITGSRAKAEKKRHKLTRTRAASLFVAYVTLPAWLQSLLHAFLLQSKYKQ